MPVLDADPVHGGGRHDWVTARPQRPRVRIVEGDVAGHTLARPNEGLAARLAEGPGVQADQVADGVGDVRALVVLCACVAQEHLDVRVGLAGAAGGRGGEAVDALAGMEDFCGAVGCGRGGRGGGVADGDAVVGLADGVVELGAVGGDEAAGVEAGGLDYGVQAVDEYVAL